MSVLNSCEDNKRTPVLKEVTCPQCGNIIEIYTVQARMIEDAVCDCGYVLKADEFNTAGQKKKEPEQE